MNSRQAQTGAALLLAVVLLTTMSLGFLVGWMTDYSPQNRINLTTEQALARAKEALIAYAVTDANRPGELPCPDTNNNGQIDIGTDTSGSNCTRLVGRLPWRTLGISELRDGSGEKLWYALSDPFHANGTTALNSETAQNFPAQMLAVSGAVTLGNVVAVVFAPGPNLSNQNRGSANIEDVTQFLEGTNATSTTSFTAQAPGETFNDRLVAVSSQEIFYEVEKRVARELRPYFEQYFADWGRYPFTGNWPGSSAPPTAQNSYTGASGVTEGLLPATRSSSFVTWNLGSSAITADTAGTGSCSTSFSSLQCTFTGSGSTPPPWYCPFFPWLPECTGSGSSGLPAGTTVTVTAYANNVGMSFVDPPVVNQPTEPMNIVATTPVVLSNQSVTHSVNASGQGVIVFSGRVPTGVTVSESTVVIPKPVPSEWLTDSWIAKNEWYKVAYYSVSPGLVPSGNGTCTELPTPCGGSPPIVPVTNPCLVICDGRTASGIKAKNVRALVTMTGPDLTGTRVSAPSLSKYLEAGNLTTPDGEFERAPRVPNFNDQPLQVLPLESGS